MGKSLAVRGHAYTSIYKLWLCSIMFRRQQSSKFSTCNATVVRRDVVEYGCGEGPSSLDAFRQ